MSEDALSEKVNLSTDQVQELLQGQIKDDLDALEALLPELGHSQAKRLLLSSAAYPMRDDSDKYFKDEEIKAFSALKRLKDATVAFGVEVVLEQIAKSTFKNKEGQNETETEQQ